MRKQFCSALVNGCGERLERSQKKFLLKWTHVDSLRKELRENVDRIENVSKNITPGRI